MKLLFKQLTIGLVSLSFVLSPIVVSARSLDDINPFKNREGSTQTPKEGNICTRLSNTKSSIKSHFGELEKERGEHKTEVLDMLKERREDRSEKIQAKRDEAKQKFEERLSQIDTSNLTDAQKAAIAEFKAAVEAARQTRKTAVDTAQATFKTAVDGLVNTRQNGIKDAAAKMKAAIDAAIAKAQADCAAGVDPDTVKETLMASIKAAHEQFRKDMAALDKIGQQIKDLTKTRNDAIAAANKAFKDAVNAAKVKLKEVFITS